MREYVVNFLRDFDYPEEACRELIEAYDTLVADEFCIIYYGVYFFLYERGDPP